MSMMNAVVFYGPKDIRIEQIPVPKNNSKEILVKVDACAVCGTDLKGYNHGNPRINSPIVMGHEFTGLVENVGNDVSGFEIGDRVVMATSISCGVCLYCKNGYHKHNEYHDTFHLLIPFVIFSHNIT